jgi:hypothetical protein
MPSAATSRTFLVNWLEFVANVIDALAWPAAIVSVLLMMRDQLRRLVPRLRKAAVPGAELEFAEAVENAETAADVAELAPERTAMPAPRVEIPDRGQGVTRDRLLEWSAALSTTLAQEIDTAPRAAVIAAFREVQRELEALALMPVSSPNSYRGQGQHRELLPACLRNAA